MQFLQGYNDYDTIVLPQNVQKVEVVHFKG